MSFSSHSTLLSSSVPTILALFLMLTELAGPSISSSVFSQVSSSPFASVLASSSQVSHTSPTAQVSSISSAIASSAMPPTSSTSVTVTLSTMSTSSTSVTASSTESSSSTTTTSTTTTTTSTSTTSTTFTSSTSLPPTKSSVLTTSVIATSIVSHAPTPSPLSTTTFMHPVFVSTTNSRGLPTSTAPPSLTTTLTSTASGGNVVTITQVGINPTLSPDNGGSQGSSFLHNRGAVAGVFVLVGLAAASIFLWIVFAIWRRRRTQHAREAALSAVASSPGFYRAPLDDDEDFGVNRSRVGTSDIEMTHRSSSGFGMNVTQGAGEPPVQDAYNPYSDYIVPFEDGITYTPPDNVNDINTGQRRFNHAASDSVASNEPLLSDRHRTSSSPPAYFAPLPPGTVPPSPPPRNPLRLMGSPQSRPNSLPQNQAGPSPEGAGDDRLDPNMRQRMSIGERDGRVDDLRDDQDYSRPVLGVRNLPDPTSPELR